MSRETDRSRPSSACQCYDPQCPECHGRCRNGPTSVLYRIDLEDETGTPMCELCAADSLESGLYRTGGTS